jgi:hypothetical protein
LATQLIIVVLVAGLAIVSYFVWDKRYRGDAELSSQLRKSSRIRQPAG